MVKKWFWRTSIVLLVIYLNQLNFNNSEAKKIGCFIDEKLCDEGEYCHDDGFEGVCEKDSEMGNDVADFNRNFDLRSNVIYKEAPQYLEENSNESNDFILKNEAENENSDEDVLNSNLQLCLNNLKFKLKQNYNYFDEFESKLISICKDNEYKIDDEFDFEPIFKNNNKENYQTSLNLEEPKEINNFDLELNNNEENTETDNDKYKPELVLLSNYKPVINKKSFHNFFAVGKKQDQKKPGPVFDEIKDMVYFNKKNLRTNLDNEELDNKLIKNDKIDFLENHKPIEEGEVRIELNEDKKIKFAEPISTGEHTPFAAVDSSYAYVYFIKKQRPVIFDDKKTKNLSIAEQSIANDDVVARRLFVQTLETKLSLPKGSFSNIKLEETIPKKISECAPFPLMNYIIKYKQNQINPNKWLTISFKVNPNSKNFNASLVANEIIKFKNSLEDVTGLIIIETGIGDKNKIQLENDCYIDFLHTFINLNLFAFAFILVILSIYFYQHHNVLKQKVQDFDFGTLLFFNWINPKDNTQYNLASKPQKLSKADLEKQALDYQELCRQRMKNDFNNDIKKQEKEPKLGSNLSPKTKNQQTSSIENQNYQPSLIKEKDPLMSVAMNMNISTGHLILEYMENYLKQNGNKINRDWNALSKTNTEDLESSQNAAKLCSSRNKNRYPDDLRTLPFDNSRVLLNDLESKDQTDYINASLILDADPQKPIYIATQGPLEQTICDFWQMIWEQGSSVIVMLTRLSENGIEQSARYWPEKGLKVYLHFEVNLISEHIWSEQYLVRSFFLRNQLKNETRTVTQFHFMDWPTNSVPNSTAAFLEFRRKVNKSYREKSSPIVVHCSDGINRTGAYCLIDLVLNRLTKGVKEIDLVATLEHLRDQRPAMITTKEQYEFCLKAIAEEVHNLLRSIQK